MDEILEIIKRLNELRSVITLLEEENRTEENEIYRGAVEKIKEETLNLVAALSTSKLDQLKHCGEEVVERIASVIPKERMQQIGDRISETFSEGLQTVRRVGSNLFRSFGEALDPDKPEKKEGE